MSVMIIDYGMSNLGSIRRALEICGANVFISDNPKDVTKADKLVLPGVGAFTDGMKNLIENGWKVALHEEVVGNKIPILGICLGMQLLASTGTEGFETEGLGLIDGKVVKFEQTEKNERIPHVGWNEIHFNQQSPLFNNILDKTDYYFVHSYHFVPKNQGHILATTPYCGNFVSIVGFEHLFGVQFNSEKSQKPGFALLKNFLSY